MGHNMQPDVTTLRIDLGINAQKIVSQLMIDNKLLEENIKEGVDLAIKELTDKGNFVQLIKEATVKELTELVNARTMDWELRQRISKAINDKVGEKIDTFAQAVAENLTKNLK